MFVMLKFIASTSESLYTADAPRRRRLFKEMIEKFGLIFTERGAFDVWMGHGDFHGAKVHVSVELTGLCTPRVLKIRASFEDCEPFDFAIGHTRRTLRAPSSLETSLGDDGFDRTYTLHGERGHALAMLHTQLRQRLLHMVDEAFEGCWQEISFRNNVWTFIKSFDEECLPSVEHILDIFKNTMHLFTPTFESFATWPVDVPAALLYVVDKDAEVGVQQRAMMELLTHHGSSPQASILHDRAPSLSHAKQLAYILTTYGSYSMLNEDEVFDVLCANACTQPQGDAQGFMHQAAYTLLCVGFSWRVFCDPSARLVWRQDVLERVLHEQEREDVAEALHHLLVPKFDKHASVWAPHRAKLLRSVCALDALVALRAMRALALSDLIEYETLELIADVLARYPSPQNLDALVALLAHPKEDVVLRVVEGLELLGTASVLPFLKHLASERNGVGVRAARAFKNILERLDTSSSGGLSMALELTQSGGLSQADTSGALTLKDFD